MEVSREWIKTLYDQNSIYYDAEGPDILQCTIGPSPEWRVTFPSDVCVTDRMEKAEGEILSIGNQTSDETPGAFHIDMNATYTTISGCLTDEAGEPFSNVFLKLGEDEYLAAFTEGDGDGILRAAHADGRKAGCRFVLYAYGEMFQEGITTLELVGRKKDGTYYSRRINVKTTLS